MAFSEEVGRTKLGFHIGCSGLPIPDSICFQISHHERETPQGRKGESEFCLGWKKPLRSSLTVNQTLPSPSLQHIPKCHIYRSFKYLRSKPPWHNLRPFPPILSLVLLVRRDQPTPRYNFLSGMWRGMLASCTAKAGYWNFLPSQVKLLPVQSAPNLCLYIGVFHWGSKILLCFWTILMFCQPIPSGCQHPLTHQPSPPEICWSADFSSSCCIHRICCVLCTNVLIVELINKDTISLSVSWRKATTWLTAGLHALNLVVQLIFYWTWSPPTWIISHHLDCSLLS